MKTAVVSYSFTGNNDALASGVAQALSAEHIRIITNKTLNYGSIALDMIFNRAPRSTTAPEMLSGYDRVLLMAPVWMGQVASPLRPYLKNLKLHPCKYAFACLSGGGLNPNPKLIDDLEKRAGTKPSAFLDLHIADLLQQDHQPTAQETGAYRLNDEDKQKLIDQILGAVQGVMGAPQLQPGQ